jgi:DNA-directed RNA polymerase specialized sigma24 family protein
MRASIVGASEGDAPAARATMRHLSTGGVRRSRRAAARALLQSEVEAADAVQDVFLSLLQQPEQLDGVTRITAIDERALTRVAYARLVRKGGGRDRAERAEVGYTIRSSLWSGANPCHGVVDARCVPNGFAGHCRTATW